jgi:hypothetical protein
MRRSFGPCLALLAALCACDNGPIDSGLPEEKRADQLTPEEAKQLCAAAQEHYEEVVSDEELIGYICTSRALAESGGEIEVCEEHQQMCVAEPPPEVETIAAEVRAEGICDPLALSTCEATVSEVELCLAEFADHIDRLYASHDCSKLAAPEVPPEEESIGPKCAAIAEECPGIGG